MAQSNLSHKIHAASDPTEMVGVLVKELKLPDPAKREGLKKIASDFVRYNQKINACYDTHNQLAHKDYKVLVAIMDLWARLGSDAVIRDQLISGGALRRIVSLLEDGPETVHESVLFALTTFTRHGGHQARKDVAELVVSSLINLLGKPGCRLAITELGVAILAHTLSATIVNGEEEHYEGDEVRLNIPASLKKMDSVRMLSVVTRAMLQTEADEDVLYHGLEILRTMAFGYRNAMLQTSSERPLVATLASHNIQIRLTGYIGLLRLSSSITEMEGRLINPLKVCEVALNMEDHFTPQMMDAMRNQYGGLYGGMITEIKESGLGIGPAGLNPGASGDYAHIGRELCKKILEKKFSLGAAAMYGMGTEGLFTRAAQALRNSSDPQDAHLADILGIKVAIAIGHREQICALSDRAIQRFPNVGFFYYARAIWTEESPLALRLSKKGLACPNLTDYVKRGLLFKSAEAGYEVTVNGVLDHAMPGSPSWCEGLAILHCAREDSKAYIEMTPIDQRNMKTALYTYLTMTFILEGDQVFKDIRIIKPYVEKMRIAEDIYGIVVAPVPQTQRKVTIDMIEKLFMEPMNEWRKVIGRLDKPRRAYNHETMSSKIANLDPSQTLANWLTRTELDDEDAPQSDYAELGYSNELEKTRANDSKTTLEEKPQAYMQGSNFYGLNPMGSSLWVRSSL